MSGARDLDLPFFHDKQKLGTDLDSYGQVGI